MKMITLIMLLMAGIIISCSTSPKNETKENPAKTYNLDTNKLVAGDTYYQCEMHPSILSEIQGECPECSMKLDIKYKK